MMKRLSTLCLFLLPVILAVNSAQAAKLGDAIGLAGGAQVSWFQNTSFNYDGELGGTGTISITPHLSGVASGWYGVGQKYGRGSAGLRATITDANDPKFSVGLGFERQWVTKVAVGEDEWVADASVGWQWAPWCILGAQGAYGLQSQTLRTSLGFRVPFKIVKGV